MVRLVREVLASVGYEVDRSRRADCRVGGFLLQCAKPSSMGELDDVRALLRSIVVRVEVEPEEGRLVYKLPLLVDL